MNKLILALTVAFIAVGSFAAQQTITGQDATKTGLPSLATKVNANFTELYGSVTTNSADRLALCVTNATLSITYTTNIWAVLDSTTNAVSLTNITPAVTINLSR